MGIKTLTNKDRKLYVTNFTMRMEWFNEFILVIKIRTGVTKKGNPLLYEKVTHSLL